MQRYEINEERRTKNEEFSKNFQLSTFKLQLSTFNLIRSMHSAESKLQRGVKLVVARLSKKGGEERRSYKYDKINNRVQAFINETGLRHTPWTTLVTSFGMAKGQYADMIQSQITLDDLFL